MVGIAVAYRDRPNHLWQFGPYMHEYLDDDLDYEIYVIEQEPGRLFNRSKLFNVAFDLFEVRHHTFVFHDVDMLPQDAVYETVDRPTHLCGSATQFGGGKPYQSYFGGVTALNCEDFRTVNGFSNEYWGWGAEDDDLRFRVKKEGLDIDWKSYRFRSLDHPTDGHSHDNLDSIRDRVRKFGDASENGYNHQEEGLNTLDYEILDYEEVCDCHKITVSI